MQNKGLAHLVPDCINYGNLLTVYDNLTQPQYGTDSVQTSFSQFRSKRDFLEITSFRLFSSFTPSMQKSQSTHNFQFTFYVDKLNVSTNTGHIAYLFITTFKLYESTYKEGIQALEHQWSKCVRRICNKGNLS